MKTKISNVRVFDAFKHWNLTSTTIKRWVVMWNTNRNPLGYCIKTFKTRREARIFRREKMIRHGLLVVIPKVVEPNFSEFQYNLLPHNSFRF